MARKNPPARASCAETARRRSLPHTAPSHRARQLHLTLDLPSAFVKRRHSPPGPRLRPGRWGCSCLSGSGGQCRPRALLVERERTGDWSKWESRGGHIREEPSVGSWGTGASTPWPGARTTPCQHWWYDGAAWHRPESLGGNLMGAPVAVGWGPNLWTSWLAALIPVSITSATRVIVDVNDVPDPRSGVDWVIPEKAPYWLAANSLRLEGTP